MTWPVTPLRVDGLTYRCRRSVLLQAQRTRSYRWLMAGPIAHFRFSCCHASMTTAKYEQGVVKLRRGDTILTTDNRALSTILVPGEHTHALLCLDHFLLSPVCGQMTHKGFNTISFAETCFHSSRFVILRGTKFDEDYINDVVVPKGRSFTDAKYARDFDPCASDGDVYCSQYVWSCDPENRLGITQSRAPYTGQLVVTPDDLYNAANVKVIYDSDDSNEEVDDGNNDTRE